MQEIFLVYPLANRTIDRKKPRNHRKKPPMCSFSISELVTTDKTTYASCKSKSPTEFFESFIGFVNSKITDTFLALRWFFGVAHRKTTDTFYEKIWLGGFLVSLTAKPPILFMGNFSSVFFWLRSPQNHRYYLVENSGLVFSLELSRRPFCDFKRYKNIFSFQCNTLQYSKSHNGRLQNIQ